MVYLLNLNKILKMKTKKNNYKEIKIDEININNNNTYNWDLCKNENACIKTVLDINKEKVKIKKRSKFWFYL